MKLIQKMQIETIHAPERRQSSKSETTHPCITLNAITSSNAQHQPDHISPTHPPFPLYLSSTAFPSLFPPFRYAHPCVTALTPITPAVTAGPILPQIPAPLLLNKRGIDSPCLPALDIRYNVLHAAVVPAPSTGAASYVMNPEIRKAVVKRVSGRGRGWKVFRAEVVVREVAGLLARERGRRVITTWN